MQVDLSDREKARLRVLLADEIREKDQVLGLTFSAQQEADKNLLRKLGGTPMIVAREGSVYDIPTIIDPNVPEEGVYIVKTDHRGYE